MNINGLTSKKIAEIYELLLCANNEQITGLIISFEAELIKRQIIADSKKYNEDTTVEFKFSDVFDINKNYRLNK